ncbi:MAG TPA: NB-ARC domain-containing protein [Pseudonocardiaceae bacterium]|nr:NB-ARC domain-containing protein [Pseudonocardiaceae bacterium]
MLLGDEVAVDGWRQAYQVALGRVGIAAIVDVADRWPEDLATFSGRDTELDQITGLAAGGGVVLCGMGGVGKTRLAVRAGHQLMTDGRFTDVQLAVDLHGYDPERSPADPAAVLDGFLRRLGMRGEQIRQLDLAARTAALRQLLAGKRALVLLDNAANAEQVRPLIPDTHSCLTLITSRRVLPSLAGTTQLVVDVLNPAQSVNLLRQVCGPDRIDADLSAAKAIAQSLGGLPLALDLVAARIKASPDWTLLDHHERLVRRRLDDVVKVSLHISYDDLQPDQQRLFRLLALHPGDDITVYAAAALTDAGQAEVQQHLDQLVAANVLLQRHPGRYGFHDLVRVLATDLTHDHDAASARNAALRRLFDHYAYTASRRHGPLRPVRPGTASARS